MSTNYILRAIARWISKKATAIGVAFSHSHQHRARHVPLHFWSSQQGGSASLPVLALRQPPRFLLCEFRSHLFFSLLVIIIEKLFACQGP